MMCVAAKVWANPTDGKGINHSPPPLHPQAERPPGGKDQITDYARRKGMTVDEAGKWLGPWLGA
jgi:hypothetical protein